MNSKNSIIIKAIKIAILFMMIIFLCIPKGLAVNQAVIDYIEMELMSKYCKSPAVDSKGQLKGNGKYDENTTVTIKKDKIPKSEKDKQKIAKDIKAKKTEFQTSEDQKDIHYKFLVALEKALGEADEKVDEKVDDKKKIEEMEDWGIKKIKEYLDDATNNTKKLQGQEYSKLREKWKAKIEKEIPNHAEQTKYLERLKGATLTEAEDKAKEDEAPTGKYIYLSPQIKETGTGSMALDDMIGDADSFISKGNNSEQIKQEDLQKLASSIYSIVVQIGVAIAVVVGLILGIKLMMAGVEGKAEVKKMLMVYMIGCIVVFGSFAIWKVVVLIVKNL